MRDKIPIHLKMPSQVLARIRAPEPIRPRHGVPQRHEPADLLGIRANVIGGDERRALAAFEQLRHIRLARFGFGVEAVPAFSVDAVARKFVAVGMPMHRYLRRDIHVLDFAGRGLDRLPVFEQSGQMKCDPFADAVLDFMEGGAGGDAARQIRHVCGVIRLRFLDDDA